MALGPLTHQEERNWRRVVVIWRELAGPKPPVAALAFHTVSGSEPEAVTSGEALRNEQLAIRVRKARALLILCLTLGHADKAVAIQEYLSGLPKPRRKKGHQKGPRHRIAVPA
jgi:hypothetical protein